MTICRILFTIMVLSSIVTFTHFVDEDSASNGGQNCRRSSWCIKKRKSVKTLSLLFGVDCKNI